MFVIGVLIHTVCALVPAAEVRAIVLFGVTVTVVVAVPVQPGAVTVRVYKPALAGVTLGIDGFWAPDVNPFGPVHA